MDQVVAIALQAFEEKEDPVTRTNDAEKHNLLQHEQWKCLRPYHKKKKFIRNWVTQALTGKKRKARYKFRVQITCIQ